MVLWNGPLGKFEIQKIIISKNGAIISSGAKSMGGGDTILL